MRKHPDRSCSPKREFKTDQLTILTRDLETQLNKSIILPKIYTKILQNQAKELIYRRKMEEDQTVNQLKNQMEKLRRQILRIDEKKMVQTRLKTQNDQIQNISKLYYNNRQMHSQHFYQKSKPQIINNAISRYQRNTQRSDSRISQQISSQSIFQKNSLRHLVQNQIPSKLPKKKVATSNNIIIEKIENKQNKDKDKHKTKKNSKKILRKFRIYAMVVYFSIMLPILSKKIYKNKLKIFMAQYPYQISKYFAGKKQPAAPSKFKLDQAKIWFFFQQKMNILKMVQKNKLSECLNDGGEVRQIKTHFQFLIDNELNSSESSKKQVKEHMSYEEQLMYSKNIDFLLPKFQAALIKITDGFRQILVQSNILDNKWKTLGLGILNNSFNNNSYPKLPINIIKSGIIRLNQTKQYIVVYDKQTQIILLINDILCRLFIYRWLCKISKIKNDQQIQQPDQVVANFMLAIFYVVCQNAVDQKIKQYEKSDHTFDQKQKQKNKQFRPIYSLMINKKKKQAEKGQLIADMPLIAKARQIVAQNKFYAQKMKMKIINTGTEIYQKLQMYAKTESLSIKKRILEGRSIDTQKGLSQASFETNIRLERYSEAGFDKISLQRDRSRVKFKEEY